jgi:hypothetical protein
MAVTAIPIGTIFGMLGAYNSFGDYTEANIYPLNDWAKFCDGSVIVDADSPMNGMYVPDLTASAPVGAATAGGILPAQTLGNIYAFGEYQSQETIVDNKNFYTIKYFMRVK